MNSIWNSALLLLLWSLVHSSPLYQIDYEPRVFDHIPLNCYDCLSYQDIILTQLTSVPARAFAHFNLGSLDTNMILNGQLKLLFEPYAFQSLVVQKPNRTLTLTFAAPNSWLNITEHTFDGLELRPYSTLRIIIKFFYGCTFHRDALSGIQMGKHSRLIIDLSSVTQIFFQSRTLSQQEYTSSIEFIISRTDTIVFDSHSFSNLLINAEQSLSFDYELVSHIHLKPYSFQSLQLQTGSSFRFYSLFLNRLTMDSYAFHNMSLDSRATFNLTIQTLGTCLCVKSHAFAHLHQLENSRDIRVLLSFFNLRGLSFLPWAFANLSLNNQVKIISDNPSNDPNPIVNFGSNAFSSTNSASIILNFSSVTVVRFEGRSLQTTSLSHDIYLRDITLVDLSALNSSLIKTNLTLHFEHVRHTRWFSDLRRRTTKEYSLNDQRFYFDYLSNNSCVTYNAPRGAGWVFPSVNATVCNCPLLYAYKHGQLDGQFIPCLRAMSGEEAARRMNDCHFEERETICSSVLHSLTNSTASAERRTSNSMDLDSYLIRQLYDRNYLTCSYNYSSAPSTFVIRSRLFNHLGLVMGIILAIFIVLSVLVMALLNGLQYKMREYDEGWTWRQNMSWNSMRRTLSQTSLRRSRRDLRTLNGHGPTSKSDNQLDQQESDDHEIENEPLQVPCLSAPVQKNIQF